MATSGGDIGYPQWTSKAEKRGVDPLGMQTTSVALYQQLVPGISNVTLRVRYYGLYAWLALRYASDVGDISVERWCLYLRRAEALYALVSVHVGGERGVAGVDWATRKLDAAGANITFYAATDRADGEPQYLKQKFGAYGAAYGSQLLDIGVLQTVPGHDVPVPTLDIGEPLAKAFQATIGAAGDLFLAATQVGTITRTDLAQLDVMLPSRIAANGRERDLYESLLLTGAQGEKSRANSRSHSLHLVLRIAREKGSSVRAETLRWSLYASQCNAIATFAGLGEEEDRQRFAWAVYQANDLLHLCYETILKLALDILGSSPTGMTFDSLVTRTGSRLLSAVEMYAAPSWKDLCESLTLADDPVSDMDLNSEMSLQHAVLQSARLEAMTNEDSARSSIVLLAILHKRFSGLLERIARDLTVLANRDFMRSLVTELRFLDKHSGEPLQSLLVRLVRQRVLDRHPWVATQKFRGQGDYTFLLESDDGRVRLRRKDGPVLTNPRLSSAIAFLEDIHLLNANGTTPAGLRILDAV
ncbi:hypothetical protein [Noviherbaspirillum suwonense]|uniref:Uncharacterized protein n=1 Tax=Noviherbaspirillum suwonense TaxID=1224511 RepID=A0ABY1QVS4_9BURK|nr:hypothetical protein [Noviherbaspirillum suwonense]SMP80287.1 hypothetical protein SAMN06295970_1355 [Noviherbaspirillum suwonense]